MSTTKTVKMSLFETVRAAEAMRRIYKTSRCPCGCAGSWDNTVSGSVGLEPAIWMGCVYQDGSAVCRGLTGADYHVAYAVKRAAAHYGYTTQEIVKTEIVRDLTGAYLRGPAERPVDAEYWASVERAKEAREAKEAARLAEWEATRPEREAKQAAEKAAIDAQRAAWFEEVSEDYEKAKANAKTKREKEMVEHWKDKSMVWYEYDRAHAAKMLRKAAGGTPVQETSL